MIDSDKSELLARFSKAFNSNDVPGTEACVTEDFRWVFYEGTDSPDARIINGAAAGCAAVEARARSLSEPIRFSESEEFQSGEKVVVTYRATGVFRERGPFDVRAVDIYTFRDGLLAEKDTYWKIIHTE